MPVRMGIIGTGGIANHHLGILAAMPDRVALVAYCDPVRERAQNAADQFGGKAYSDAAAMYDA
ncbi:MAG TPA: Gfo/Idh/MocA family oxidoreductase, partial [Armatimonadota bacterium]|nr:Gfo/Idh/MocA family oxidoreductase [Armatimonadota bacterium]